MCVFICFMPQEKLLTLYLGGPNMQGFYGGQHPNFGPPFRTCKLPTATPFRASAGVAALRCGVGSHQPVSQSRECTLTHGHPDTPHNYTPTHPGTHTHTPLHTDTPAKILSRIHKPHHPLTHTPSSSPHSSLLAHVREHTRPFSPFQGWCQYFFSCHPWQIWACAKGRDLPWTLGNPSFPPG